MREKKEKEKRKEENFLRWRFFYGGKGVIFLTTLLLFLITGSTILDANKGNENFLFDWIQSVPYGDKMGHFFVFGIFALLLNTFLEKIYWKILPAGSLLVVVAAFIEEFSQKLFPARNFDYYDLLADIAGVIFFSLVWFFLRRKK